MLTKFSTEKKQISEKTCPNDCGGNGKCNNGKCECNPGFSGYDCSKEGMPIYLFYQSTYPDFTVLLCAVCQVTTA